MAVKYVKDFAYDPGFGFTGSSGKSAVRPHMRSAPKAPGIAPAMVEQRSRGLGGLTPETKNLASYNKPHMEGKKGPSVQTYAKGGLNKGEKKIGKVMGEFKRGELHSGSKKGPVVRNPKQAVAIALSEARGAGAKIPKKKAMGGKACG